VINNFSAYMYIANSVNVDVQASDWQTARRIAREDWRSFTLENGEQSAMICSTISML